MSFWQCLLANTILSTLNICQKYLITGLASLFGEKKKKILSFSSRSKRCRICSSAKARGVPPRKHNCRFNWHGSAKAMVLSMACEMLTTVRGDGAKVCFCKVFNDYWKHIMTFGYSDSIYLLLQVGTFVMHNESTTIANV